MAALDMFVTFNASLSDVERQAVRELIQFRTDELLDARSEDARVRLISNYIDEVREWLRQSMK